MLDGRKVDLLLFGGLKLDRPILERYNRDMSDINVDPNRIINDLLDQIRRLTADNAVLRAALGQANEQEPQATQTMDASATIVEESE